MELLLALLLGMITVILGGKVAKQNFDLRADDWLTEIELGQRISLQYTPIKYRTPTLSTLKDHLGADQPFSLQEKLSISLQGQKQYAISLMYNDVPLQELRVPTQKEGVTNVLYDLQDSILPVKRESDSALVISYKMEDGSCISKEYVVREDVNYESVINYYVPTDVKTPTGLPVANCDKMFKEKRPTTNKVEEVGYVHTRQMGWVVDPQTRESTPLTRALARDVELEDAVEITSSDSFSLDTRLYTKMTGGTRIGSTVLYKGNPLHEVRVPTLDNMPNDPTAVPGDLVNAILPVKPQDDQRVKVYYLMQDDSCKSMEYDLQIRNDLVPPSRYYIPVTIDVPAVDPQLCKKIFGSKCSIRVAKESFRKTAENWETDFSLAEPKVIPRALARDVLTPKDAHIVPDKSFSFKAKVHVNAKGQKHFALLVVYKDIVLDEVSVTLNDQYKDVASITGDLVNSILPVKPKNDNRVKVFYWLDDGSCTWREYHYHEEYYYNTVKVKYYLPSTVSPAQEVSQAMCKKLFETPVDFSSGDGKGFFQRFFFFSSS